jgi:hypothetical protein
LKVLDDGINIDVTEAVDVICQEYFFILDVVAHRIETLANGGVAARIHERNVPMCKVRIEHVQTKSAIGEDEITREGFVVIQEELLD